MYRYWTRQSLGAAASLLGVLAICFSSGASLAQDQLSSRFGTITGGLAAESFVIVSGNPSSNDEVALATIEMISTIECMRCWFVPIRPVTPFMMIPILCVFIVFPSQEQKMSSPVSQYFLISGLNMPSVDLHNPIQEFTLVVAPVVSG